MGFVDPKSGQFSLSPLLGALKGLGGMFGGKGGSGMPGGSIENLIGGGGGDPGAPTAMMDFGGDAGMAEGLSSAASFFARGGRVDDDALLYHAIDTQPFKRGGALRACSGGYTR